MKLTQIKKAAAIGVSQGEYSKIIGGNRPVNINFAKKVSVLIGRDFTDFLTMEPHQIDKEIRTCLLQKFADA